MENRRKKRVRSGFWRGTSAVLASVLALTVCGTSIANAYSGFINGRLGTSNYRQKTNESGSVGDGIYFRSEFEDLSSLIQAKEQLGREIASEGAVLLKNNDRTLPLDTAASPVTIWGLNSRQATLGGLIGSTVSVNEKAGQKSWEFPESMEEVGFRLNDTMRAFYDSDVCAPYIRKAAFFGQQVPGHSLVPSFGPMYEDAQSYMVGEADPSLYPQDVLASADDTAAIVFLSRDSSEAADYSVHMKAAGGDRFERPLALSDFERRTIALAKEHSNGQVIVLLNSDIPMEIEELKRDSDIDAIVWAGLPGAQGFLGVADVLAGAVNPSGHLPDTYAVRSTSAPAMTNFGVYTYTNASVSEGSPLTADDKGDWYVVENEGIYVGYKYYETRYEDEVLGRGNAGAAQGADNGVKWTYVGAVSYPFGYGLSYTTFEQTLRSANVQVGGEGTADVEVKNTGDVPGKSVVQLYVQTPYTEGGIEKAAIQLVAFAKTKVLEPGQSEAVHITFDPAYIASYDEHVTKADGTQGGWVLDEGTYYFAVGNDAHDALNHVLAKKTGRTDALVATAGEERAAAVQTASSNADKSGSQVAQIRLDYDCETYSAHVENALQEADLNHWIDSAVTYIIRSDWSLGWDTVSSVTATDDMLTHLKNSDYALSENGDGLQWDTSAEMQLIDMAQLDDKGNMTGTVSLDDPVWDRLIEQISLKDAVNFLEKAGDELEVIPVIGLGVVNTDDGPIGFVSDQLPGYAAKWSSSESNEPTYVKESDERSGYYMATFPTAPVVAATFNTELIQREGELLGEDSLWTNVAGIIGPGTNLHRTPYCSRNHEYYSEDAMLSNRMTMAVSEGGRKKGLMVEPKHFAFNHQESNRSGVSTYFTEQAARENELRAFQGALSSNKAMGLMTAFNRVGPTFAGACAGLNEQILRREWGYTGWVLSDMVNGADYMNWRNNIMGGGGGCLTTDAYASSKIGSATSAENMELIQKDTKFQQQVRTALKYFLYTIASSNAMNGVKSGSKVVYVLTGWQIALIALNGILALALLASLILCGLRMRSGVRTDMRVSPRAVCGQRRRCSAGSCVRWRRH